jgi:hypothetical protein
MKNHVLAGAATVVLALAGGTGLATARVIAGPSSASAARPALTPTPAHSPLALASRARRVPRNLVGKRLNAAESELDSQGIGFRTVGGGIFGIVLKSDWGVCDTIPHGGAAVRGPVKLVVGHFTCGA